MRPLRHLGMETIYQSINLPERRSKVGTTVVAVEGKTQVTAVGFKETFGAEMLALVRYDPPHRVPSKG